MQSGSNGRLLVYASNFANQEDLLKSVSLATKKMARFLNLNFELVTFAGRIMPIYVYYKNGDEEPIPIYCNKDEKADTREVCTALKNMMFVLSFHPRHSDLKQMRRVIMQFS